jgi:hypothetical protein
MGIFTRKTAFLTSLLCLGTLLGPALYNGACADIIHMYNGKVIHTKIKRVTGEIIEYTGALTGRSDVKRIELTSRRDVVETRNGRKYFGEIIYIDKFKVEMQTPTGRTKINRLLVINIVLGTPKIEAPEDYVESNRQQYSGNKPLIVAPPMASQSRIPAQESEPPITDDSFSD